PARPFRSPGWIWLVGRKLPGGVVVASMANRSVDRAARWIVDQEPWLRWRVVCDAMACTTHEFVTRAEINGVATHLHIDVCRGFAVRHLAEIAVSLQSPPWFSPGCLRSRFALGQSIAP